MINLFEFAERFFLANSIEEKLVVTHYARHACIGDQLIMIDDNPQMPIDIIGFPEKLKWQLPRDMPSRKLTTVEGVRAFFHAIAHVEFTAMYLAWDILYRFRGLPDKFYWDWLRVADEEAQHFALITAHLKTLNCKYGDLPVHSGLWEHAKETAHDVLARLAMIPRCMEARGLDVTPVLMEKFNNVGDEASILVLQRILTDEIGHVSLGSDWFRRICQQKGVDSEAHYRQLLGQYHAGGKPKGPFNRELRKQAGFSDSELDWLESVT